MESFENGSYTCYATSPNASLTWYDPACRTPTPSPCPQHRARGRKARVATYEVKMRSAQIFAGSAGDKVRVLALSPRDRARVHGYPALGIAVCSGSYCPSHTKADAQNEATRKLVQPGGTQLAEFKQVLIRNFRISMLQKVVFVCIRNKAGRSYFGKTLLGTH